MNKNCRDILSSKENRNSLRKNFCPFIRYLEETDPDLKNITSYMRKMETYLFKILKVELIQIKQNLWEWSENNLSALKSKLNSTDEIAVSFYLS